MSSKTVIAVVATLLGGTVAYVLNRRMGIDMAPGGAGPELNTEPG